MKEIYQEIWDLARPYYLKGRPMDINHIEWIMKDALKVSEKEENVDGSLLVPLAILHDVGYGVTGEAVYMEANKKKAHMVEGAKVAREILGQVGYDEGKIERIADCIEVHDNWIFGDHEIYKRDLLLGVFTDLDYIWMATPKGFHTVRKILNFDSKEMYEYLVQNEKPINRPFATETTRELYREYMMDRKEELGNL